MPGTCKIWDGTQFHYFTGSGHLGDFLAIWQVDGALLLHQWTGERRRYEVTTEGWRLLEGLGLPDATGQELFEEDWVEWRDQVFRIGWDAEWLGYALFLPVGEGWLSFHPLHAALAPHVRAVGNTLESPHPPVACT